MATTGNVFVALLVAITKVLPSIHCHSMDDAQRLFEDKTDHYNRNFRPRINQSLPVTLGTHLELISIKEFDEVQEQLTITAVFIMVWTDEYVTWNQSNYGGMTQLVVNSDQVWTPNLVLINNVNKLRKIGDTWHKIRFFSDGTANFFPGEVFSASCAADVTYYPLDSHQCSFHFTVWAHLPAEVRLIATADKVQTSFFSENGGWTFYDSKTLTLYDDSVLEVQVSLKRKPLFVIVNVIIPIILMAYLNTMIFCIPTESGERISYSITVLLAIAVFLTVVGDNLPKTSSSMSVFSHYVLVILILSVCITLAAVLNLRLYFRDDSEPISRCWAILVQCLKSEREQNVKRHKHMKTDRNDRKQRADEYDQNQQSFDTCTTNINEKHFSRYDGPQNYMQDSTFSTIGQTRSSVSSSECNQTIDGQVHKETSDTANKNTWKDVSIACDKLYFVISVVTLTLSTAVFFAYIIIGSRG